MAKYVISDVHGNLKALKNVFNDLLINKSDEVYFLGDLIDRGKDSKAVLDFIMQLISDNYKVTCLMGNHEQLFIDAFSNKNVLITWLMNGGDKTLSSFLTGSIDRIPIKYFEFIKTFKYYQIVENYILVHASLNMKIENPFDDLNALIWERNPEKYLDKSWLKNRIVIHGHTPIKKLNILNSVEMKKSIIGIDNGSYIHNNSEFGAICVLELDSFKINFIYENN